MRKKSSSPSSIQVPVPTTGHLAIGEAAKPWLDQVAREAEQGTSEYGITYAQFQDAYAAVSFANCYGIILDTRVDVTWSTVGHVGEAAALKANSEFMDLLRQRAAPMNFPLLFIAVHEVGTKRDLHTHYMIHVPSFFQDKGGRAVIERLIDTTLGCVVGQLDRRLDSCTLNVDVGSDSPSSQWARFKYMMKGVSPHAVVPGPAGAPTVELHRFAELDDYHSFQGRIVSARVEVCNELASARRTEVSEAHPDLPDFTVRTDGPQLYGDRCLDWHRRRAGLPHFAGEMMLRNPWR